MRARISVLVVLTAVVAACNVPKEYSGIARSPSHGDDADVSSPPKKDEPGRKIDESERWALSDPHAVKELRGTDFGEREIREFWTRKGWRMTKQEERYLDETKTLLAQGTIQPISRWAKCPYTPVYRAKESTKVMGVSIDAEQEFHFEMCENENEVQLGRPRFQRVSGYREDHPDGHATDPSKKPNEH